MIVFLAALAAAPFAGTSSTATAAVELEHRAVLALIDGRRAEARRSFGELARRFPGTPLALKVPELLAAMDAADAFGAVPGGPHSTGGRPPPVPPTPTLAEVLHAEKPTGLARALFATGQTILGAALGGEICAMADCSDVRPVVGSLLLGGGAALTLSLLLTQDGITAGRATMLNNAGLIGLWHGVAVMGAVQPDESRVYWAGVAAGQVLGLGVGVLLAPVLEPSAGDVLLATSGALWGGAIAAFSAGAVRANDTAALFVALLAASDAGLIAGGVLSRFVPMSVTRVMIIDLGGMLGTALGMGIDALAQGADVTPGPFFASAIAGSVLGLGVVGWLTRDWDLPEIPLTIGVVPMKGGLGAAAGFRW